MAKPAEKDAEFTRRNNPDCGQLCVGRKVQELKEEDDGGGRGVKFGTVA